MLGTDLMLLEVDILVIIENMICPHCSAALASGTGKCGYCEFSVATVRGLLGSEWVRLERITDNHNCLSLKEQRHLEVIFDAFERMFPQCFFVVFLGAVPLALTSRDLGFWLVNHGAFHTHQISKRNDFGVALVIDCLHQNAALTLGYALEAHVRDADARHILNQVSSLLDRRRYGQAVERVVKLLGKKLAQAGTRSLPEVPAKMAGSDLGSMGLQTLRAAHRPAQTGSNV
ncbi:hypothetical protein WJU23_08700 [Prosthecobacter sp. SYSU 5D2]|uniref:TPM domain-containing protein n=1 Tax=Prosthecobacter sp. SYSU 5D2 TaxID=3134134 RepID=UPI0031FEAECE